MEFYHAGTEMKKEEVLSNSRRGGGAAVSFLDQGRSGACMLPAWSTVYANHQALCLWRLDPVYSEKLHSVFSGNLVKDPLADFLRGTPSEQEV